ncbi:ketopantoate reductase family protein [Arthrobacter sp. KNU-44]|uniref:ketopantoate reductase family protein n=1 Tax=Arthrobacter sp. KNU-44 TaxID=3450744 RepID=UPI003F42486F
MDSRRIAILGAGANGASIGADLVRAGEDVVLIDQWPENVENIRRNGLTVELPHETLHVPIRTMHLCELASVRDKFDVVLMLVKAYDSDWAARIVAPYLAQDGLLVGVQNGMSLDIIAAAVGHHRTLGCVIEITSAMFVPGVVERHSPAERSWFAVGSFHPSTDGRENEVAGLLRHSGTVEVVGNIRAAKWMKLTSNATTLVTSAILGVPIAEAASIPKMRQLMLRSGNEALEAATLLGYPPLPIFGLSPESLEPRERLVETLLDTLIRGFVLPQSTSTVLQDWGKLRRSEVDDINGLVVNVLQGAGRSAPANAAVVSLAHRIERGQLQPGPDNLNALLSLSGTAY